MTYKLSDTVLARLVQIVQEGMIFGTDVVDIMRMVEVEVDPNDPTMLVPNADYMKRVEEQYTKAVQDVEVLEHSRETTKLLIES